jgi:hypothetical protein
MNTFKFLVSAYVATWLIHSFYIGTLVSRFRRLRQTMKELGRDK